ncbi:DUF397 domain-containing protein [Actinokineospora inagensis]|uniref:DUF397 domain-containing protein n=1 Tax=Actinokineospora inagensis TaxID=103730 RepID=UPI0009FDD49D|nr:DUF397 domain-containing protein [Actinokineospora inagensis]
MRFKKSTKSVVESNCVEVSNTLRHLRDSKNPTGPLLIVNVPALIHHLKSV